MKWALGVLVGSAIALAASAGGSAKAVPAAGVVVARQHGVVLVASSRGTVTPISGRAAVGARVLFAGGRVVRTLGRSHSALVRGVVVRRTSRLIFLSAARHLLVIHTGTRGLASVSDTPPAPGSVVQTTVAIDDQGQLDDEGEQDLGQTTQAQVQATVTAVGAGTVTLTVNGQQLTFPLQNGLTLPSSLAGTQVTLNLSFANGQATADQQDDNGDQPDQVGEQSGSGDQPGQGDSSDSQDDLGSSMGSD
jgi:hypothetical protein